MSLSMMHVRDREFPQVLKRLLRRNQEIPRGVEDQVQEILDRVRRQGDRALLFYTRKFDGVRLTPEQLRVPQEAVQAAYQALPREVVAALRYAAHQIQAFHRRQRIRSWTTRTGGHILGQRVLPLDRVGFYVPGGKAVYPSTVLMNVIPAQVAGVSHCMLCTPPSPEGVHPAILVAADLAGVQAIYTVGGVQAIAAMAYGTETIPRVDKIVGPGNIYVTLAKKRIYGEVGIDLMAGPSEILVLADETAPVEWVSLDLLSQAEHDEQAVSMLITPSLRLARRVQETVRERLKHLSRKAVIRKSLKRYGWILLTEDLDQAIDLANQLAPEHLSLQVRDPEGILPRIRHAGAIFLGAATPQALGDYVAGPSHVLPTGGTARFASPLSVEDFVKRSSIIGYSDAALAQAGSRASVLARAEGLEAHALAVEARLRGRNP